MKKTRYTEEQIAFALKQAETGTRVGEVCRKMGISEATFYNWKKKFAGLGVTELRRLRQLEDCSGSQNQDTGITCFHFSSCKQGGKPSLFV
ncbi:hypothetical protein CRG94_06935 [Escherichia sp. E3356]|nr:hypothetical protein CRG94_06935 [Escherichia sp. E3356]